MKTDKEKLSEMIPVRLYKNCFNFNRVVFSKISFKTIFMFHDELNDILKMSRFGCQEESKILLKRLKD
jgi:hypothetical protein